MDNLEVVLNAMDKAGQPLSAGQIVEMTGLDKKEVDKVLKKLKDQEKIHSPKRCYWAPKK